MYRLENGNVFIEKGTPIPLLCPKCNAIIPYIKLNIIKCWACEYEGDIEEFDDIEFISIKSQ